MLEAIKQTLSTEIVLNFHVLSDEEILADKMEKAYWKSKSMEDYVAKILKALPDGYSANFFFNQRQSKYVHFIKESDGVILEFRTKGRQKNTSLTETFLGVVALYGVRKITLYEKLVKRNYKRFYIENTAKSKIVRVNLKRNYKLASKIAFEMATKVYKYKKVGCLVCSYQGEGS